LKVGFFDNFNMTLMGENAFIETYSWVFYANLQPMHPWNLILTVCWLVWPSSELVTAPG
jgi:hypothetical protein